jgi:tetraacyldisaccharide 4'-kinase
MQPVLVAFTAASHYRVLSHIPSAASLPVPVISVGNITLGGTAKTPMVEHLARSLKNRGFKPGIATRGWKGNIDKSATPPELVSDGKTIFLEWQDCGDEPRLLAESLLDAEIPVAVGRNRAEAGQLLIEETGVDIILLDDGFQFTTLKRDFDLVLIDSMSPFGRFDGGIGILREPISSISRADAVVLTRVESVCPERIELLKALLINQVNPLHPIWTAAISVRHIRNQDNSKELPHFLNNLRVLAFSGIANPLSFRTTLLSLGCRLSDFIIFPDHHPYSTADLDRINRRVAGIGPDVIVTTTKDAVRLSGRRDAFEVPLKVVEIGIEIENGKDEILLSSLTCRQTASPLL